MRSTRYEIVGQIDGELNKLDARCRRTECSVLRLAVSALKRVKAIQVGTYLIKIGMYLLPRYQYTGIFIH